MRELKLAPSPGGASSMHSQALALHRRARSGEALSILDRSTTTDDASSLLLRARLSITLSPSRAIAILGHPRFEYGSSQCQAEAAMLRGRAHTRLREYDAAERCFASAHSLLSAGVMDGELLRDVDLAFASLLIAQSRIDEAENIANALSGQEKAPSHAAATFILLAQVAWHREQLDKNAGFLLQALRSISTETNPDVPLWAETLKRLAVVSQFVASPAVRQTVAQHATVLPWTEEIADWHSQVNRLLGTRAIVDGAITDGLALLKCSSTTPGAALHHRISALLTHADVSKWLDEPFSFEEYLLESTALAQQVDWRTAPATAREILLQLAEMHARRDSALALSFAAHFDSLGGFGPDNAGCGDSAIAQRNHCIGALYVEIGEKSRGIGMLEAAYAGFLRAGFDWPAGQTAIVLAEHTKATIWRSRARERLARYPHSFLKKRLERLDGIDAAGAVNAPGRRPTDPKWNLLTATQRTVYFRLLESVSVKEIAADLDRSDHTIRNHVQAIFRKFGVNSRADLVRAYRVL